MTITPDAVDQILDALVGTKVAPKLKTIDRRALCGDLNRYIAAFRARLGPPLVPTKEGLADLRTYRGLLAKQAFRAHLSMLGLHDAPQRLHRIDEYLAQQPFTSRGFRARVMRGRRRADRISKGKLGKFVTDVTPQGLLIAVDLAQVWRKHFETRAGRTAEGERASPFIKFVAAVLLEAGLKPLSVARIADIIKAKGRVKHGRKRKSGAPKK